MKKMIFPYTAFAAVSVYLLELVLVFIKRPDLIGVYAFSRHGFLFVVMALSSVVFYFLVKHPSAWIQSRGMFTKILLQILALFAILLFPLGWYDFFSHRWFAGVGTIVMLVFGIPVCLILAGGAYFLQKNQVGSTVRIYFLNFVQIILSIVLVIFFASNLSLSVNWQQWWQDYEIINRTTGGGGEVNKLPLDEIIKLQNN